MTQNNLPSLADSLREATTVLDEKYHRVAVSDTLMKAADEIERLEAAMNDVLSSFEADQDEYDRIRFFQKLLKLQQSGEVNHIQIVYTNKHWDMVHVNINRPERSK